MIDVSIIIPVYNADKYLKRCVESLTKQQENIEILLIDDCSTDKSREIAKQLQEQNDCVKVIELEKNQGVSNARNVGIEKAKGEYIMFSDADDWYEENAISTFVKLAKQRKADFIIANHYVSYENKKIKVDISSYFSKDKITKEEIVSYMTLSSWAKLIKKDLFIDNNVKYPIDLKRCEELEVIPIVAYKAKNPIVIEDVLYNYYQRANSASNKIENDLSYFDKSFERFKEQIDEKKYKEELEFRAIEHLLYGKTLVMLKNKTDSKKIIEHIEKFKKSYPNFMKNKYLKNFNKAKRIFIYTLNYKTLILSKIFAVIHDKFVG